MKKFLCTSLIAAAAMTLTPAYAQKGYRPFDDPPPPRTPPVPPPVYVAPPTTVAAPAAPAAPGQIYVYDQKLMGGRTPLVSEEQFQAILSRFKEAYPKLGSPRLLIYVNRELVDEQSGMKLIRREERIDASRSPGATSGSVNSTTRNTYRTDGKAQPTLADRQTVRDIERLFGRPLRSAGAALVDQRVASQLIADKPLDELIGTTDTPQARKDREALARTADVVIEILVSSKTTATETLSGTREVTIPDIQATAIRLEDSKILGQVSSSDVTARASGPLASYSVGEIAEATALALMEDVAAEAK